MGLPAIACSFQWPWAVFMTCLVTRLFSTSPTVAPRSVTEAAPDREVLEEVAGPGEGRDATIDHDRSRLATRFVRR